MSDVTQLIDAINHGDRQAADQLLPLLYDELRLLASHRLAHEKPGQTLQATALVHEAYMRLVGDNGNPKWDGRAHFFGAAAEAMRRILIDNARAKNAIKRGGERQQLALDADVVGPSPPEVDPVDILALDEALTKLAAESPAKAQLVKLRYFAGFSLEEAAQALGISERTAKRHWVTAKGWLFEALNPHS
jgi:RNA polymerase sigma factor (TIGR02999 family)